MTPRIVENSRVTDMGEACLQRKGLDRNYGKHFFS